MTIYPSLTHIVFSNVDISVKIMYVCDFLLSVTKLEGEGNCTVQTGLLAL